MMAITVDSLKKVITIHTDHSSYQMQIDRFGYLIHLYYGQRTAELMDHLLVYADRGSCRALRREGSSFLSACSQPSRRPHNQQHYERSYSGDSQ